MHGVFGWRVGWDQHEPHGWIGVGSVNHLHGPRVGGVAHFKHTCPLKSAVAVAAVAVAVAVIVCATHARNGHAERILAFRLKFKHVLACFHVEHVDRRSSIAALGVVKRHLRAERIVVAVVVLLFVVVAVVVLIFVVVVFLAVVGEGKVVASVIAVKLLGFVGVMCEGVNVGCGRSGH